jgi:hypothetical protein
VAKKKKLPLPLLKSPLLLLRLPKLLLRPLPLLLTLLLPLLRLLTLLPPLLLPPSNLWQAARKTGLRAGFFSPVQQLDA